MDERSSARVAPGALSPSSADETAAALLDALWDSPVALAIFDPALRFMRVNDALARINGAPAEAHVGRRLGDLAPGEPFAGAIARIEDRLRSVFATGRAATHDIDLTRSDGSVAQVRCAYHPAATEDGAVRAVCAIVADVTAEREREASLERARRGAERSATRLALLQGVTAALSTAAEVGAVARAVVERIAVALDAKAVTIRRVGPDGFAESLAVAGDPGGALRVFDAALPGTVAGDGAPRHAIWLESLDGPGGDPGTVALLREAGHASAAGLPLTAAGKVLGVLGLLFDAPRTFDLEERAFVLALAEQAALALDRAFLFDSERRLREEAERAGALLDGILENAPVGVAVYDRELRFLRVNAPLARMNGLPVEAHLGRTPRELLPGFPVDDLERGLREVLETGRPILDVEMSGETPAVPGKTRHWLQSWYPVRAGGAALGVGALVREVTAEREAHEFQRNVLGIVGHDLRNPLTAISASAQLLSRGAGDARRVASRIVANAARMNRIIAVLVDYARVRGGQPIPLRRRTSDVAAICRGVAEELETARPGRTIAVHGQAETVGPWDPDRIGQVIANLLANALDYSPPASAVELAWRASQDEVEIEIANEGAPIPPHVLPRLFEPFRRAEQDGASGRDGLGLGLFIARSIVAAHGGRIDVRSAPAERTVFTVRLPRG